MPSSTQVQLVSRPQGWPTEEDFRTVTVQLPDLAPGQVRVRNEFLSVDPYMRGRMNDGPSYSPPFALGETMTGAAVGHVEASTSDALPVGTLVLHGLGWRDVAQDDAAAFRRVDEIPGAPSSLHLGLFGMTGLTAYAGLTAVAGLREGERVFVSGAAGAVGTAAGQIARLLGAGTVIGSAGSAEKVALLTSRYGYDVALDYKAAPIREQLRDAAPDGIDVFFDNVGGDHLEAALDVLNPNGRAAICGSISAYNDASPTPGPDNLSRIVTRTLTLRGFLVGQHADLADEYREAVTRWFADGRIAYEETVVDGVENAVTAFLSMMRGGNAGKMVVRV